MQTFSAAAPGRQRPLDGTGAFDRSHIEARRALARALERGEARDAEVAAYADRYSRAAAARSNIYYLHVSKSGGSSFCECTWRNGCYAPGYGKMGGNDTSRRNERAATDRHHRSERRRGQLVRAGAHLRGGAIIYVPPTSTPRALFARVAAAAAAAAAAIVQAAERLSLRSRTR
mgnify:CR=1 FL=1